MFAKHEHASLLLVKVNKKGGVVFFINNNCYNK